MPGKVKTIADVVAPGVDPSEVELPRFAPDDLIGLSFLKTTPDGQMVKAQLMQKIQ